MLNSYLHPFWLIAAVALAGLFIGSWLARAVYIMPRALESAWRDQFVEAFGQPVSDTADGQRAELPLYVPDWRHPLPCAQCGAAQHRLANLPVLGAFVRPSVCNACGHTCGWWMHAIQWLTGLVFGVCAWRYGYGATLLFALVFCAALIVLAFIDAQTTLLPDVITLPLLWLGLLVNSHAGWAPLSQAVWGAALGYACLWLVYHAFKWTTGKEGMGFGDFKLLAALGAWLGLGMLPWVLLAASLAGVTVGIGLRFAGRVSAGQPLPFGPYLSTAGVIAVLFFVDVPH